MFGAQYALNQKMIVSALTFEGNYQWENVSQQEMSTTITLNQQKLLACLAQRAL